MISTVDQSRTPLLTALLQQATAPHLRFYTPGHKGGPGSSAQMLAAFGAAVCRADLPELPGFDNLFAPQASIQAAQELAAAAFGADHTYFLVNGSSGGLMAALLSVCRPGEEVIVPRNSHQSILHGLILAGARPIWMWPSREEDIAHCLTPAALAAAISAYPQAKAAIAISPSYEGVCGNVAGLARVAHQGGIPLIVDEAHGPHLGFHPAYPASALSQGADLVVQSTHKVLSAFSQASMLHCRGHRIDRHRLQASLRMIQTSSPSALLLASLDAARQQWATQGEPILEAALTMVRQARRQIQAIPNLDLLAPAPDVGDPEQSGFVALDPLRLTIKTQGLGIDGFHFDDQLASRFQILAELPAQNHLTFTLGLGNSAADLDQLVQAVQTLCSDWAEQQNHTQQISRSPLQVQKASFQDPLTPRRSTLTPQAAFNATSQTVPLERAVGRISQALVCPYPPGIPILFPGETITAEAIAQLCQTREAGGFIVGAADAPATSLQVIGFDEAQP
ncbi:aminotransferase class I/II-fold pyridoxal phosphate-dependent enzyme [Lyngbya confervoides]|uniref:DegT/DnrJ/EryC1/StrS family aminotransferase n=1 Tax=Lyngbya confervoides BDU141951 TaxID=1574623 RepID=A0ABD4T6R5_9CYAN|nr:aminotransferase class I/II-fold pyridoxal phosphate-dependent enzyme [Lyngbya confervoides]MCM1984165.1 DegT/DnrJ/EryC1/StrS family aminotransferase [Lyngbya confervoides BDU141951]